MSPWSRDGVDAEASLIVYDDQGYVDDQDFVGDLADHASYHDAEDFDVWQELLS